MGKILAVCISEKKRNSKGEHKRGNINRKLWT